MFLGDGKILLLGEKGEVRILFTYKNGSSCSEWDILLHQRPEDRKWDILVVYELYVFTKNKHTYYIPGD